MDLSIYALGDGAFMAKVLNGIAGIDYGWSSAAGGIFAIIILAVRFISSGGREMDWGWAITGWAMFLVLFSYRVDGVVIEEVSPHLGATGPSTYVVDNVPFGAVFGGIVISNVGYRMAAIMERGFGSATDRNRVMSGGLGKNLQILSQMRMIGSASLSDEGGLLMSFRASLTNYIRDCTMPGVNASQISQRQLDNSSNALEAIRYSNRYRSTTIISPVTNEAGQTVENQEKVLDCAAAHDALIAMQGGEEGQLLVNAVNASVTQMTIANSGTTENNHFDDWLNGGNSSGGTTSARAGIVNDALSAYRSFGGEVADSGQKLVAAHMVNAVRAEAMSGSGLSLQDGANIIALEQAAMQRNTQWAAEENLFVRMLKPAISFFESYFYALFPLMSFIVLLGRFGASMVMKYAATSVWVALWYPVLTICSAFANTQMEHYLAAVPHEQVVDGIRQFGYTTTTSVWQVSQQAQDALAFASTLAAATPALALSLVYGSAVTMTHLAGRLQGGDHFNEKISTPDAINPAAALNNAPILTHSIAGGTTQADVPIPTYKVGMSARESLSSTESEMVSAQKSVQEQLSNGIQKIWQATNGGTTDISSLDSQSNQILRSFVASHMQTDGDQNATGKGREISATDTVTEQFQAGAKFMPSVGGLSGGGGVTVTDSRQTGQSEKGSVTDTASAVTTIAANQQLARAFSEGLDHVNKSSVTSGGSISESATTGQQFTSSLNDMISKTQAYQTSAEIASSTSVDTQLPENVIVQGMLSSMGSSHSDREVALNGMQDRLVDMNLKTTYDQTLMEMQTSGFKTYSSEHEMEAAALVRTINGVGVGGLSDMRSDQNDERINMWGEILRESHGVNMPNVAPQMTAGMHQGIAQDVEFGQARGPSHTDVPSFEQVQGRASGAMGAANAANDNRQGEISGTRAEVSAGNQWSEDQRGLLDKGAGIERKEAELRVLQEDKNEAMTGRRITDPVSKEDLRLAPEPSLFLQSKGFALDSEYDRQNANDAKKQIADWQGMTPHGREYDLMQRVSHGQEHIPAELVRMVDQDTLQRNNSERAQTGADQISPSSARIVPKIETSFTPAEIRRQLYEAPESVESFLTKANHKIDSDMSSQANKETAEFLRAEREYGNPGSAVPNLIEKNLREGLPIPKALIDEAQKLKDLRKRNNSN